MRAANDSVTNLRKEVQTLQRSSGRNGANSHPAATWHPNAPKLLDLIARNRGKFKHEPVGPIGMYASITDERCAPVAIPTFLPCCHCLELRRHIRCFIRHPEQSLFQLVCAVQRVLELHMG